MNVTAGTGFHRSPEGHPLLVLAQDLILVLELASACFIASAVENYKKLDQNAN
jgi:hypothetical protein